MMADLVGDYVGLGEFAGRPEAGSQFIEEAEVEVHLLIARTVEGASGAGGLSAARINRIAKEDQFGTAVGWATLRRKQCLPGSLGVVEYKGYELHGGVGLAARDWSGRSGGPGGSGIARKQREQIALENEAEQQDNDEPTDAEVGGSEAHAATLATVFYIVTDSAWFPVHTVDGAIDCPIKEWWQR